MAEAAATIFRLSLQNVEPELREINDPHLLGIHLGIPVPTLERFERDHRNDISRQRTEVIKYWLKNGTVTWEALARAVERVGGHKHLVTRLRSRKATDELVEGAACMGDERSDNTEFEPKKEKNVYHYLLSGSAHAMGMKTESGLRSEDELARETLKIMKFDFNTLITAVRLSLQRRRVSVESLLCHLRSIEAIGPSFKPVYVGHSHSLKTVTSSEFRSLEEVFVALAPYCSWFNYLIIENIIETFCEGDKALERKWMRFQEKVRRYCERRVIDCPEDQYGERDDESMVRETVAMKVDRNWSTIRVDQLYHIRDSVAKVLDIKPCNLYLCTVEKGCVRVVLYIPDHVVSKFNCTASTEMALRNIDVIDISYVTWKSKIPRKHRRLMANVGSDLSFVQYSPPAITEPDLLVVPYSPPAATLHIIGDTLARMAENYQVQINTNSRLRIGGAALILYRLFYPRVYMATCLASYPFTLGVLLAIHLPWPLNCGIMSITVIGIVLLIIGNNNTTEVNIDNLVRLLI